MLILFFQRVSKLPLNHDKPPADVTDFEKEFFRTGSKKIWTQLRRGVIDYNY